PSSGANLTQTYEATGRRGPAGYPSRPPLAAVEEGSSASCSFGNEGRPYPLQSLLAIWRNPFHIEPSPGIVGGDGELHIALFLRSLAGGGAERSMANLAAALAARGLRVDVVLGRAEG